MQILFNDINYYVAAKQNTLCQSQEHTKKDFFTIIRCVNISYSFFNKNEINFYLCLSLNFMKCRKSFIKKNLRHTSLHHNEFY